MNLESKKMMTQIPSNGRKKCTTSLYSDLRRAWKRITVRTVLQSGRIQCLRLCSRHAQHYDQWNQSAPLISRSTDWADCLPACCVSMHVVSFSVSYPPVVLICCIVIDVLPTCYMDCYPSRWDTVGAEIKVISACFARCKEISVPNICLLAHSTSYFPNPRQG